jgi:hypothetical protein
VHVSNSCGVNNCVLCTCNESPDTPHCAHCYHCISCSSGVVRGCHPCAHAPNHRIYRTYLVSTYRLANGELTNRDPRRPPEDEEVETPELEGLSPLIHPNAPVMDAEQYVSPESPALDGHEHEDEEGPPTLSPCTPLYNPVTPPSEAQYLTPESLGSPLDSPVPEEPEWPGVESDEMLNFGFSPCVYPYDVDQEQFPSPAPLLDFDGFEGEINVDLDDDDDESSTSEELRVQALVAIEKLWGGDIRNVPGYREEETETAHGEDKLDF